MKALILAAGRGSRMGSATEAQPKCFSLLDGKRLLDWQISSLKNAGVSEIGIVTGYCHEQLEKLNMPCFYNSRWSETNMVQSLRTASAWLRNEEVIVSYSDIVYRSRIVKDLIASPHELSLTFDLDWYDLWKERFENPLDDAETFRYDSKYRILEIGGKTNDAKNIQGQFMGLFKITPLAWKKIESLLGAMPEKDVDRLDTTKTLKLLLNENYPIYGVPIHAGWCEVDSEVDQRLYESKMKQTWSHDWRAK